MQDQVWTSHKSATVWLFRQGKCWGGASLKVINPQRRLQRPGGTVIYVSNLRISGEEKISAVVDCEKRIGETNENNDIKLRTLRPQKNQPNQKSTDINLRTFKQ